MACETCVENISAIEMLGEELVRLRRTNKILRTVNSALRAKLQAAMEEKDELFLELCRTDKAAEVAMGELWGSAEFDCGPEDYDYMVEQSIEAMREMAARRTKPIANATSMCQADGFSDAS